MNQNKILIKIRKSRIMKKKSYYYSNRYKKKIKNLLLVKMNTVRLEKLHKSKKQ